MLGWYGAWLSSAAAYVCMSELMYGSIGLFLMYWVELVADDQSVFSSVMRYTVSIRPGGVGRGGGLSLMVTMVVLGVPRPAPDWPESARSMVLSPSATLSDSRVIGIVFIAWPGAKVRLPGTARL